MNSRILELAKQCGYWSGRTIEMNDMGIEKFAELIKRAIYDDVKEELIEDEIINIEPDSLTREYLKGCNGGTVDALFNIKNFGVDVEE